MNKGSKKMSKKDPQYMLFIFGDLTDQETTIDEFGFQLVTIVTSEHLKYTYGEYGIVFNFRSSYEFIDIKEFIDMVFSEMTDQYFLMEVKGEFDLKMPKKLKKDFLNIDGENKKVESKNGAIDVKEVKFDQPKKIEPSIKMFFPLFDPMFEVENEKPLSVDQILDKINESGLKSLTEKEVETLNNYGKRKNRGY
jgi:hypothetical protein